MEAPCVEYCYTLPTRILLIASVSTLYALHQDVWLWRTSRPLVFGFLPAGLAYHALYCVAVTMLMWALTRLVWPSHLEHADTDR